MLCELLFHIVSHSAQVWEGRYYIITILEQKKQES